ncbi:hypothetical protein N7451_012798 [Penicillium sp. IBT 35674x]|nr:hypothetical protein N7451_012798 [Penicillium sp. IBT 35674x]
MGDSFYMDWWQWISHRAQQKVAVIVSPKYRLLPEGTGVDIYRYLGLPAMATLSGVHGSAGESTNA